MTWNIRRYLGLDRIYLYPWMRILGCRVYGFFLAGLSWLPFFSKQVCGSNGVGIDNAVNFGNAVNFESAYIEKQKARLLATFLSEDTGTVYNASIDPCFYSTEKYNAAVQESQNQLETSWKQRILIESTPRGTVAMYYDAFKRGFAYYSDQYVPYPVINAVCMKYAVVYRCRDFFLDESVLFGEKRSPFLLMQEEEEKLEKEKKAAANKEKGLAKIDVRSGPFAKLKANSTAATVSKTDEPVEKEVVLTKNKILYLGKWVNFSILNKTGLKGLGTNGRRVKQAEIPFKFKDYMALKMKADGMM
jgi:hypothetical protein